MTLRVSLPDHGLANLPLCPRGLPQTLRNLIHASYSSIAIRVAARDVSAVLRTLRSCREDLTMVKVGKMRLSPVSMPDDGEPGSMDILVNGEALQQWARSQPACGPPTGSEPPVASGSSLASSLARLFQESPAAAALDDAGISYKITHVERTVSYENLPRQTILEYTLPAAAKELGIAAPSPPTAFETVGHIAHYNLRSEHLPFKYLIGAVTLDTETTIRTVVTKPEAISGVFRACPLELIAGEPDYVAEVHQGGMRFRLDFSTVYWNSRLGEEHGRVCASVAQRIREASAGAPLWVLDATGGVGPFAITLAVSHGLSHIVCNDLNPEAYRWMQENVSLNRCGGRIECRNEDARDLLKELLPSRRVGAVLLNLPELSLDFLRSVGEVLGDLQRERSQMLSQEQPAPAGLGGAAPACQRSRDPLPWFYVECFSRKEDAEEEVVFRAMGKLYPRVGEWLTGLMGLTGEHAQCPAGPGQGGAPGCYTPEFRRAVNSAADIAFEHSQAVRRVRMVSASRLYCCLEFRLTWLDEEDLLETLRNALGELCLPIEEPGGSGESGESGESKEPLVKRAC